MADAAEATPGEGVATVDEDVLVARSPAKSAFGKIAKAAKPDAGFATPSAQARGRLKSAFAPSPVLDKLGLDAAFSPTDRCKTSGNGGGAPRPVGRRRQR